jgi:SAM-dependent methyltransferase
MTSAADEIVGLYQRHAAAWAADRGTKLVLEKPWLDRFLSLLPAKGAILDLGCGSADPIARYLIEQGNALTGADSSPALIALCAEKFPGQVWHVADMRALALARVFDGILAWDSFFHLSPNDQRMMFPVFRRHAAPGAALMFTSGPAHGEAIGAYRGEPLYHASLDAAEYRALLAANGFKVVAHVAEDPDCGRHTIWLAQFIKPSAEV